MGDEIPGGALSAPPPPLSKARNSQTFSRVCLKNGNFPDFGEDAIDSFSNFGLDSAELGVGFFKSYLPSVGAICSAGEG